MMGPRGVCLIETMARATSWIDHEELLQDVVDISLIKFLFEEKNLLWISKCIRGEICQTFNYLHSYLILPFVLACFLIVLYIILVFPLSHTLRISFFFFILWSQPVIIWHTGINYKNILWFSPSGIKLLTEGWHGTEKY